MKLTLRSINDIKPDSKKDIYKWDDDLAGFGVRIKPSGVCSFMLQYRNANGVSRRLTLCKLGVKTPDEARKLAKKKLAEVANGSDPANEKTIARQDIKVSELCDMFIKETAKHIKHSTLDADIRCIECHIKPLLGKLVVKSLTIADIEHFKLDVSAGKTAKPRKEKGRGGHAKGGNSIASRTISRLSTILSFAKRHKIITENPAIGVKKFADVKRNRFLSIEEIEKLGKAIREAETENKTGVTAIIALLLTGCRRNEILGLPWDWLDAKARCIRFGDTKTGEQTRPIGISAVNHLSAQPKNSDKWIFPAERGEGHFIGLPKVLGRLCQKTEIKGVTLHTLRHTFASVAAELGYSELTIAGLLGHTMQGVTARYSHLPDRALLTAADAVSAHIMAALSGEKQTVQIIEFEKRENHNA
jgi:integrase